MIHVDLADAISGLDDELLDDYLTRRAENLKRLRRRRAWFKGLLSTAACLLVVLSVVAKVRFDRLYPYIPLENAVGDVSVRYVPEWMVQSDKCHQIPNYTEEELFIRSDYIFSGTIIDIEQIAIDCNRSILYRSIITVTTDRMYRGNYQNTIRIVSSSFNNRIPQNMNMLHKLHIGDYGIFITQSFSENEKNISFNNCSVLQTEFADVTTYDSYGFALIKGNHNQVICYDTIHEHPNKLFTSLLNYNWNCIFTYLDTMTE